MKLNKILLVTKTGRTEFAKKIGQYDRLEPKDKENFSINDVENKNTIDNIVNIVKSLGIEHTVIAREYLNEECDNNLDYPIIPKDYDLVISIGGDGTFIDTAQRTILQPIMGVKSTSASIGALCTVNYHDDFERIFERLKVEDYVVEGRFRLEAVVDDELTPPAINEIEIGATIREERENVSTNYEIHPEGKDYEFESGSGLLISPKTGSTGWYKNIREAIHTPFLDNEARWVTMQYDEDKNYKIPVGAFFEGESFRVKSKVFFGRVHVDNARYKIIYNSTNKNQTSKSKSN
ncbi:hypothetical protein ACFL1H_02915 [Nanoarchaeota archaeon]